MSESSSWQSGITCRPALTTYPTVSPPISGSASIPFRIPIGRSRRTVVPFLIVLPSRALSSVCLCLPLSFPPLLCHTCSPHDNLHSPSSPFFSSLFSPLQSMVVRSPVPSHHPPGVITHRIPRFSGDKSHQEHRVGQWRDLSRNMDEGPPRQRRFR